MKSLCIIDLETVDFKDLRILEIAAVRTTEELNIIEEIEVRTNIVWPIDHISGVNIPIGKYTIEETKEILKNFINKEDLIAGFNIAFEEKVLRWTFINKFDLMYYMKRKYNLLKYSLDICASISNIKPIEQHRALGDCLTILQIMKKECLVQS